MKNIKFHSLHIAEIEQHLAWHGKLSEKEVSFLLSDQRPFTYVISASSDSIYRLSYVTTNNREIKHQSFRKVSTREANGIKHGYRNGANIIFSTVDAMIRYKLKGKGILPELPLLRLSV